MIIEWNHHLWSRDTETYPFNWMNTYIPSPDRRSEDPLVNYRQSLDERGVDRAVLVQPTPYGDDHSLVLDAASQNSDRFRVSSLFPPRDPKAPRKLEDLVAEHGELIAATRIHSQSRFLDSFQDDGVRRLWQKASDLDLAVELHLTPDYAKSVAEQIKNHPNTPVVIDHLAEPQAGNPAEYANVLALAEYDNVYMKLSSLDHFSEDGPLYESVRPFTQWVIDAFGPGNMVWGKGSPEIVDVHLQNCSESEREKVKGDNVYDIVWSRRKTV